MVEKKIIKNNEFTQLVTILLCKKKKKKSGEFTQPITSTKRVNGMVLEDFGGFYKI